MEKNISFLIHEISKTYIESIKKEASMQGINPTYRYIFMAINSNSGGVIQSDICNLTRLKPSSISLTLDQMENEGLIIREKDALDNRKTIVKLSSRGIDLDNKLKAIFKAHDDKIIKLFSNEDKNALFNYLEKILVLLKEMI